jgi:DNA-binding MarR family transcriptional regulator
MSSPVKDAVEKPKPLRSLEQAVFLNLQKAADLLMSEVAQALRPAELSPTQYNVLRILRAAGREGLACGRIAERMLTREPDMTRLLDRLEKRKLIERWRDTEDRRVVRGRISADGLNLLKGLDEQVLALHRDQLGHLSKDKLRTLANLLESVRNRTRIQ